MTKSKASNLQLVAHNTEKELEDRKYDKQPIDIECLRKRCGYKWRTTIGQFKDNPKCPKCGSEN